MTVKTDVYEAWTDLSERHRNARRVMGQLLLDNDATNAAKIKDQFYETITLAEHEATRMALAERGGNQMSGKNNFHRRANAALQSWAEDDPARQELRYSEFRSLVGLVETMMSEAYQSGLAARPVLVASADDLAKLGAATRAEPGALAAALEENKRLSAAMLNASPDSMPDLPVSAILLEIAKERDYLDRRVETSKAEGYSPRHMAVRSAALIVASIERGDWLAEAAGDPNA